MVKTRSKANPAETLIKIDRNKIGQKLKSQYYLPFDFRVVIPKKEGAKRVFYLTSNKRFLLDLQQALRFRSLTYLQ